MKFPIALPVNLNWVTYNYWSAPQIPQPSFAHSQSRPFNNVVNPHARNKMANNRRKRKRTKRRKAFSKMQNQRYAFLQRTYYSNSFVDYRQSMAQVVNSSSSYGSSSNNGIPHNQPRLFPSSSSGGYGSTSTSDKILQVI